MKISRYLIILFFCLLQFPLLGQSVIPAQGGSELSTDPEGFLVLVRKAFEEKKRQSGAYPATWEDAWPEIMRSLPPYYRLTEDLHGYTKTVLKVYDPADGKTVVMVYRIVPVKKGFSVYSDSSGQIQDWIISDAEPLPWWYFPSEKAELRLIREKEWILSGEASFIPGKKDLRRERHLVTWKFHHRRAFDILFRYVKNPAEDYNFRISAVKALIQMPALYRFSDKKREIDRIIRRETDIPLWDSDWRRKYLVELLRELRKLCVRNNPRVRQR